MNLLLIALFSFLAADVADHRDVLRADGGAEARRRLESKDG